MEARTRILVMVGIVLICGAGAQAVTMDWVTVGNLGNSGELSGAGAGGWGPDRICGAVAHTYQMGKYEATAGQYADFLNAVARTDTYGLYNIQMDGVSGHGGCNIRRSGASAVYVYTVPADWANRPVNYVSWGDAVRFANWMTNGQPTGPQGLSTTEDGSYYLNGANTNAALLAVTRKANARCVVPTEDEWYKAAYHKNDGVTGNYWDYPTGSNTMPSNDLINPDPGNNANFFYQAGSEIGWTLNAPYFRNEVGEFENSESPYGTFDQGGNVMEWNEAVLFGSSRGVRGGAFYPGYDPLRAAWSQDNADPLGADQYLGFRVAYVPEPATLGLLTLSLAALGQRRRRGPLAGCPMPAR